MAGLSGEDRVIKIWLALTFTPNGYGKTSIDCYQAIFQQYAHISIKNAIFAYRVINTFTQYGY